MKKISMFNMYDAHNRLLSLKKNDLENIMPSERSQKQKATFYASLLRKCPEYANPETENNYWLPEYGRWESEKCGDSL